MSNYVVRPGAALVAVMGSLAFAASAGAATLSVDDDGADCPAATYSSIQAAVDAAAPGDTVTVCAGDYVEGSGAVGTNALTITKDLTLKGAGADLVSISPKASGPASGRIMEAAPDLRNGVGDVVAVVGAPKKAITVHISGVTVDGFTPNRTPVAVEAGVVYLDAKGSIVRSRVTNTVTSEGATVSDLPGGYRGPQPGVGIAQTSAARTAPGDGTRTLSIELTRVDKYNKYGVLIDGATNDTPPLLPSGTINRGVISASQIVGRTQCVDYAATGNCSAAVVGPITTGPLFGQDGIRVTAGARAQITDSLISQNLVNGDGAPTRETLAVPGTPANPAGTPATPGTNNQNLKLGAGIRLVGAFMTTLPVSEGLPRTYNTSVTGSNIVDNAYGALNLAADGTTTNTGTKNDTFRQASNVLLAENNWWGLRISVPANPANPNPGPLVSPTSNPIWPENPVGGTAIADSQTPAASTSNSVDFFPYRNGVQSDPDSGQFAIADAAMPVDDAAPTGVTIGAESSTVAPGGTVRLTAAASDDFGVARVRIYDGGTLVGDLRKPAYVQSVAIPADAACGSTRTYTALATDSLGQSTRSAAVVVTVACPNPQPTGPPPVVTAPPAAPTVAFSAKPVTIKGSAKIRLAVTAPAGVRRVDVRIGDRLVCADLKAPYACTVKATGADVGAQALTATVTDAVGSTAVASTRVTVAKFTAKVALKVTKKTTKGGKAKRTVRGTLRLPSGVTKAQGCRGTVTVTIKRAGQSVLNQQVKVSKACTFTRSVTASRSKQRFTVSARFGGTSVLKTASSSRRFS